MKIGAAWKKTSANGKEFISLTIELPVIGKVNFALFQNDEKKSENQPDYNVVWSPKKDKDNDQGFGDPSF